MTATRKCSHQFKPLGEHPLGAALGKVIALFMIVAVLIGFGLGAVLM